MVLSRFSHWTIKHAAIRPLAAGAAIILALGGCSKKAETIRVESAELEKAFLGIPAGGAGQPDQGYLRTYVSAALAASRSNDYVTAVLMLQKASETPGVTPQQILALQTGRKAWVNDLMARAVRGDEKAKAALEAIGNAH